MYKFVKIKCDIQGMHPDWFLAFDGGDIGPLIEPMGGRLLESFFLSDTNIPTKDWVQRLNKLATTSVDYHAIFDRVKKPLYIRKNGTYMVKGSRETIVDEVMSNHFPVTASADIVVCENSEVAEVEWVGYLKNRFPNKSIKTINFFDSRGDEEVSEALNGAEFVTFSTTFSSFEWFDKLLRNVSPTQKIIGFCHDEERWADLPHHDIEVIHKLK